MSRLDDFTLNPLSAGDIIDRAARLYKRNISVLLRIALVPTLIEFAGSILLSFGMKNASLQRGDERVLLTVVMIVVGIVLRVGGQFAFFAVLGGASRSIIYHFYDGTPINVRDCLRSIRSRFFSLLGATIIIAIIATSFTFAIFFIVAMIVGLYALVIGEYVTTATWIPNILKIISHIFFGLIVTAITIISILTVISRIIYVPQVMMVEAKGIGASITRSIKLAGGEVKRIGAVILFWIYAGFSIGILLMIPINLIGWWMGLDFDFFFSESSPLWVTVANQIIMQGATVLILPVAMLAFTLMYVDVRVRKEGFDVELLANRRLPPPSTEPILFNQFEKKEESEPISSYIKHACLAGVLLFSFTEARASDSLNNYDHRINEAWNILDKLTDTEYSAEDAIKALDSVKQLLPKYEDVELNGRIIHVDNTDIYLTIESAENAKGNEDTLDTAIYALFSKLGDLMYQVDKVTGKAANTAPNNPSVTAQKILDRAEYKADVVKESRIKQFLRELVDKLLDFFRQAFPQPNIRPIGKVGRGSVWVIRVVILLLLAGALAYGLFWLRRRVNRRKIAADEEKAVRTEILGELIPDDVNSNDLFASAMEAAKVGNYRLGVRRAYVAMLLDMSDRRIVKLHRSKTNRDYLNELKSNREIFPRFSNATGFYENIWYGQRQCTMSEFELFLAQR